MLRRRKASAKDLMSPSRSALAAAASLAALCAAQARADEVAAIEPTPTPPHSVSEVVITARRLDAARDTIQPETGASSYTIPNTAIQALPGGDNAGLNEVVLQMPGVAQDSYGQLHVRGDHANIQYRFNGVILPEGLSFFGQVLSPRIANSIELITGALPAEYGLRTAGILDIRTKSGFVNGGQAGIYGGSHGEWEPSIEYGGSHGSDSYFGSASYTQNQLGVESPDGSSTPRHDRTDQIQGFGYFDHVIDESSRISFFSGLSSQTFQIPDRVGLQPTGGYQYDNITAYPSARLNQTQKELNAFVAGSYLYTTDRFTGQASMYARYSSLQYNPDNAGELLYNGLAQTARKEDIAIGLQAEGAYRLGDAHTVRAGLIFENDRNNSATSALVFTTPLPLVGNDAVESVVDDGTSTAQTYSAYVQDEWKVFDHFVLNYGLRFDQLVAFRRENQLSPRVNFVWTPLTGFTVHGGYARYFTPPPFELVASTTLSKFVGTVAAPNVGQDTTPYSERDNYYDLGIQQKFTPALTLGLDAYYRTSRNLIDEGQFGAPIIETPFNYRYGKNHGVEFTAAYDKGPFTSYFNLAYSRALGEDINTSQFNFSPQELAYIAGHYIFLDHNETWSSSFGVAYHWHDTKVALDGNYGSGLRATGANDIPNGLSLPTYTTFNMTLQQKIGCKLTGPMTVRFDVVNLTDKLYEIRDGTGVGVGAPQWGARRGFFVGLTKPF
jgi:outer membrane receptor protein involved in Fe transport